MIVKKLTTSSFPYSVPAGFGADALQQEHYRSPTNVRTLTPEQQRPKAGYHHGDGILPLVLYPPVLSWKSVVYSSWFNKSEFAVSTVPIYHLSNSGTRLL